MLRFVTQIGWFVLELLHYVRTTKSASVERAVGAFGFQALPDKIAIDSHRHHLVQIKQTLNCILRCHFSSLGPAGL